MWLDDEMREAKGESRCLLGLLLVAPKLEAKEGDHFERMLKAAGARVWMRMRSPLCSFGSPSFGVLTVAQIRQDLGNGPGLTRRRDAHEAQDAGG